MTGYAVGFPDSAQKRGILIRHGWVLPGYTGDLLRPCASCGMRLLLTTRGWALVQERRLRLFCPFCADDRRNTRPMTAGERMIMLGD
jgi:hypothetical protein